MQLLLCFRPHSQGPSRFRAALCRPPGLGKAATQGTQDGRAGGGPPTAFRGLLFVRYPGRPPQPFVQIPEEPSLPPHAPSTHAHVCSGVWAWSSQDAMKLCPFLGRGGGGSAWAATVHRGPRAPSQAGLTPRGQHRRCRPLAAGQSHSQSAVGPVTQEALLGGPSAAPRTFHNRHSCLQPPTEGKLCPGTSGGHTSASLALSSHWQAWPLEGPSVNSTAGGSHSFKPSQHRCASMRGAFISKTFWWTM